jgi:hypothetical protein
MNPNNFSTGVLRFCAWTGPIFVLMWLIGAGPTTGWVFLPPPSAADSAAKTVADYTSHLVPIRIGCILMIFSCMFYTSWGMVITMLAKKAEQGLPILFYIQVVSLAACVVVVLLIGFFWGAASFRAGETAPEVTQALNDLGWLGVLFTGAPFTAWAFALSAVTLMDKSLRPVFPRWTAYLNIFAGITFVEAALILCFKTGPFSQNGLFVFYLPMVTFFVWIVVLSWVSLRAIAAEAVEQTVLA